MAILDTIRRWGGRMATALNTPVMGAGGYIDSTPATLRPILSPTAAESAHQRDIIIARAFHSGEHQTKITDRLEQFLGKNAGADCVRLNFTRKISTAIAERLIVEGWDSDAESDTEKQAQREFAEAVWRGSRMAGKRALLHQQLVRDGELFILVDYDAENQRARWTPHQRYTDPASMTNGYNGDGEGMLFVYPNNDTDQRPLYAVKRWTEHIVDANGRTKAEERLTVYRDDRIERYARAGTGWVPYVDTEDDPWPTWWTVTGTESGEPLGIPAVHVKTPTLQPATLEAIPIQKALNKTFIDLIASSDANAFRIMVALGWSPFDADGVALPIQPGTWIGTEAEGASVQVVEGADLSNQIAVIDKTVALMADVSDVPLSLLNRSNQRAAEGTLQEEKESFLAKVRDYQETVSLAYSDAMRIARRVQNTFGPGAALDEAAYFEPRWAPLTTRTVADRETEARARLQSGYTEEEVQRQVWGEDEATIARMQAEKLGEAFAGLPEGE